MLPQSFCFLPRVGVKTERRLWVNGVRSWEAYRKYGDRVRGITPGMKRQHDDVLAVAEQALLKDPAFFAELLPQVEHWRAFGEYGKDAAYVDIETTGGLGGRNDITVVGVKVGDRPTQLLTRGIDLTPDAVTEAFRGARSIVTFNGSTFDVPMLRGYGADLPHVPHLDLRHALARLGYKGGLKKIEKALGVDRGEELDGVDGYHAVILWHKHELGDEEALPQLLHYNRADVEGMIPLAEFAYEHLREATFGEACRHGDGEARRERPLTETP